MAFHVVYLIAGFILLISGANHLVEASSKIAKKLGVSDFIIGLTLVAVGTSIPEIATAITASIQGYPEMVIGNVLGANISNIALILAVIGLVSTVQVHKNVVGRDGYILAAITTLFLLVSFDRVITPYLGLFLLSLYVAYVMYLVKTRREKKPGSMDEFIKYFLKLEYVVTMREKAINHFKAHSNKESTKPALLPSEKKKIHGRDLFIIIVSIIAITIGANLLVKGAVGLAELAGVSRTVIALTVISFGTTLPELSVSLSAALKKYGDLSVGNLIGSCIANLLLIIGISSLIRPIPISDQIIYFVAPLATLITVMMVLFLHNKQGTLSKLQSALLLIMYVIFVISMFLMG